MTDDDRSSRSIRFESDLAAVLREATGPGAPPSLRYRLAEVTREVSPVSRSWFSPLRLASAGAALVVVAVAVALLVFVPRDAVGPLPSSSQSPAPSVVSSPSTSPSVEPSPTPAPTAPASAWSTLTWSKGISVGDGRFISDLVAWGNGYVGVGGIETGAGLEVGFFTSTDGSHWTLVQHLTTTDNNVLAARIARVGSRLIAMGGAVMNGPGELPGFPPPLWTSTDGTSWASVQSPTWDAAFSAKWPARLLASSHGVVALSIGSDPVVVSSSDGVTWAIATLPVAERAVVQDATVSRLGFVIVGRDGQPDHLSQVDESSSQPYGIARPAAWISQDGATWSEAAVEGEKAAGANLGWVVAVRAGLLAVGIAATTDIDSQTLTSWFTPDGLTWSRMGVAQRPPAIGIYPVMSGDGDQAIVFGKPAEGSRLGAWVTADGSSWTALAAVGDAPATTCPATESCFSWFQAWVVPNGVIVSGTPGGMTAQTMWFAAGS